MTFGLRYMNKELFRFK